MSALTHRWRWPRWIAVVAIVLAALSWSTPRALARDVVGIGVRVSSGPVTSEASRKMVSRLRGLGADFRAARIDRHNAAVRAHLAIPPARSTRVPAASSATPWCPRSSPWRRRTRRRHPTSSRTVRIYLEPLDLPSRLRWLGKNVRNRAADLATQLVGPRAKYNA